MNEYYQQSIRALQLAGMSERTQECYTRAVRMVADFYGKSPDQIAEPELEEYFLHRRNADKWSAATLRIAYSGIKFFFVNVLEREWNLFTYLRAKREQRLPCILSKCGRVGPNAVNLSLWPRCEGFWVSFRRKPESSLFNCTGPRLSPG